MKSIEEKPSRVKVAFDSNFRPKLWKNINVAATTIERAFKSCDIALPSLADQKTVLQVNSEDIVASWFKSVGVVQTVLKRGSRGPRLVGKVEKDCKFFNSKNVIDTTAAGDSFNAGFLASQFTGSSAIESANYGHQLANFVISQQGAICTKSYFDKFMESQKCENEK